MHQNWKPREIIFQWIRSIYVWVHFNKLDSYSSGRYGYHQPSVIEGESLVTSLQSSWLQGWVHNRLFHGNARSVKEKFNFNMLWNMIWYEIWYESTISTISCAHLNFCNSSSTTRFNILHGIYTKNTTLAMPIFGSTMSPGYQYPCSSSGWNPSHYSAVIMGAMASQITSLAIVYSTIYSGADQRKHQSSMSLAFVRRIHRSLMNFPLY